ncbi:CAP domain-containing protein [Streptomyces sp. NPDC059578]|uniref:CAP domain-containing protein n=1 Tax=unclassified Streptomyces TaxID=2593676 RepID=UPI0036488572
MYDEPPTSTGAITRTGRQRPVRGRRAWGALAVVVTLSTATVGAGSPAPSPAPAPATAAAPPTTPAPPATEAPATSGAPTAGETPDAPTATEPPTTEPAPDPARPPAPEPAVKPTPEPAPRERPTPQRPVPQQPAPQRPAAQQPGPAPVAAGSGGLIAQVTALVNAQRVRVGCRPVTVDPRLNRAAARHSQDMGLRGYFGHASPEGRGVGDRVTAAGYAWSVVGENVAAGPRTARAAMDGWMASPAHRANILHCPFTHMGLGVDRAAEAADGPHWTQVFARPEK